MSKIILQGLIIVASFFATWFVLKNIDWMTIFRIEQATRKTEEKLGDLFWDMINKSEAELKARNITAPVDSILNRICISNDIDKSQVKVHIIQSDDINAFALPNHHLVIYSGLIAAAENEAQLSGVIGHELAHMELNHVMKKLIKEIGLSVLISMTTGNNGGSETIKGTVKLLSSSAFDRKLEKDADLKAVDYLTKANIDPAPFADFLYSLSEKESQASKHLTWISTHPDSKDRAEYIIEYCGTKRKNIEPILSEESWEGLKGAL